MYNVQCTVWGVQCTVYSVQCTLYTEYCRFTTVHQSNVSQTQHLVLKTTLFYTELTSTTLYYPVLPPITTLSYCSVLPCTICPVLPFTTLWGG